MGPVIDFHVHILPDTVNKALDRLWEKVTIPSLSESLTSEKVNDFKRRARNWLKPYSRSLHQAQTVLRHLPEPARKGIDQLGAFAPLPLLLVESTPSDLQEAMTAAGVDYAVAIASPPFASNEFILEACQEYPKLIAAVNIPSGTAKPGEKLREYVKRGAKLLKIHPAVDGEGVDSPRYKVLLTTAADLGIPVILHTGCIHTHLMYRDPAQGHAQRFAPWFPAFPQTRFILAHMNFHEPNIALDLAEENDNVLVDTSWQPAEVIGEAVRRIGAERVFFGTDWPLVGQNIEIGIRRVRECIEAGTLNSPDADLILGGNAAKLLGLKI